MTDITYTGSCSRTVAGALFGTAVSAFMQPTQTTSHIDPNALVRGYADAAMRLAVTRSTEQGTVIAEIPSLDGVWTYADTEKEARADLKDMLVGWIEFKRGLGDRDFPHIDGAPDLNSL